MVKLFKHSKKLINTLILTSFIGMLCFSSIRADAAEGLQETISEEQNVRAASDIDDRNDNFINCRDSGTLCTLIDYMASADVNTTNTYVDLKDNRCPSLPATYAAASGSTDNSWLFRTMYLDDVYNAQTDIYLAQGNISKTSTISKSVAVDSTGNSYKANKLWLAYSTKSDEMGYEGGNVIPIPGMPSTSTAWYNSGLTTIKKFNAKGSGAANTPGIQRLRADGSVAIPTYFTPINEIPKGSLVYNDRSGDYLVNIRMPIYGLTPYVKITGLDHALDGYTLRKATPYYYTDDTKWISGFSGSTAASTDMYIASDMNSMILYAGATTSIAALNAEWSRHVYTFTFDCNEGQYNTNTLVKRWDMLANQKFPLNKKIAPTELSSNSGSVSRKGYDLDGWYTGARGGTKIFNANGTACNAATSYWATVYNSETRENNYQLIKYTHPLLDDITGVYSLSNVEATNNRVYTYDQNGNRTGVFPMYAHWNPYPYKVRYVFNNGDSPAMGDAPVIENWIYADEQNLRSAPTRKGYTFRGWKISNGTDGDYADGTVFSASQEVKNLTARKNRTVTLTAQWTPNPYKVTFHANYPNGTDDTSAQWTIVYDSNGYINETAPKYSYDNYHIVGYKYANSDTRLYNWNGDVPNPTLYKTAANTWWDAYGQYKNACNIDVYAIWERDTFTLKYDSNGGSAVGNEIIYSGLDHLLPSGPTRDGYTFVGWAKQGEKDFYGNAVDQSIRSGYYKNESSTNPLNNGRANGNNSKYYFKTVTSNCPGEATFNLQKPGGEITFVAIWAHYHNEANMDNLSNAGNNGQVYSHTTHGNNSFYVNTSNQNIFNISAGNTWLKTSPWYTLTDIRLLNSSGNNAPNSQSQKKIIPLALFFIFLMLLHFL